MKDDYRFPYGISPGEMTVLGMANIYRSMPGVVNMVFTVSLILVTYRFWDTVGWAIRVLMILGAALFPLLQPGIIYLRSRKIVSKMPRDMEMRIRKDGISIDTEDNSTLIEYGDIATFRRIAGLLVLQTSGKQSYVLSPRHLGKRTEEVFELIRSRIRRR
jgi:hypothetical protein